ncbi:MAG TPA: sphingomyelin phosphodiesterase, partial [Chitinophagales bacterium]|nr:sphingomyelin phosphodiesterase [Chitinophagales bacterium]
AQQRIAKYEGAEEVIPDNELRILSWNIQMLPRMLLKISRGPMRRSRLIPQHIISDQADIIVFQEAFDPRARRILKRGLKEKYPYIAGPANSGAFRLKTNSGIWMLSKIPLKELGTIDFKDCESEYCLARKGALLAEAEWQGVKFQILGTHLEAGGPDSIKRNQYREIRGLIDEHQKPNVPQFLCGDFNTDKTDADLYPDMLNMLDARDDDLTGELVFTSDEKLNDMNIPAPGREIHRKVIDYILFRGNGFEPLSMERSVRQYRQRWNEEHKDLSDHNAVLMRVILK